MAYKFVGGTTLIGTITSGECWLMQVNKSSFSLRSGLDRELAGPPGSGFCDASPGAPFLASRSGGRFHDAAPDEQQAVIDFLGTLTWSEAALP